MNGSNLKKKQDPLLEKRTARAIHISTCAADQGEKKYFKKSCK
jgi:hypothetical protein